MVNSKNHIKALTGNNGAGFLTKAYRIYELETIYPAGLPVHEIIYR
jgi:hypothetical protein